MDVLALIAAASHLIHWLDPRNTHSQISENRVSFILLNLYMPLSTKNISKRYGKSMYW